MIPSSTLFGRIAAALLANLNSFGTGTFELQLSQTTFTLPDGTGFSAPNFTGYGAIAAVSWIDGIDPNTLDRTLHLVPPVGGFKWTASNTTNLPQTIYGMRVART